MPDPVARLSAVLADRYRVEREVWHGGMAGMSLGPGMNWFEELTAKVGE